MIKGILFDVGGTLYSYRQYPHAVKALCAHVISELSQPDLDSSRLEHQFNISTKTVDSAFAGEKFFLFKDYFQAICLNFLNTTLPADRVTNKRVCGYAAKFEELVIEMLELRNECHSTLDQLLSDNLYLGVVSNSDIHQLDQLIDKNKLRRYFDDILSSEAARSCKPDTKIFSQAIETSELQPQELIFVGDSVEQDIAGAKPLGMTTVLIRDNDVVTPLETGSSSVARSDYRINHLDELVPLVRKINTT